MDDATGWTPVTAADGTVAGWMAAPDPDERDADYFEADRLPLVGRRAGLVDQAAALLPDPSFDADQAVASGMTWAELDSASYVALALRQAELSADDD